MEKTNSKSQTQIPAFSAIKQESGFQIKVTGRVSLQPSRSPSDDVIGVIHLADQVVPVLDLRQEKTAGIADSCCIVFLDNPVGDTTIMTGRLYENSWQVYELIVESKEGPRSAKAALETVK